jgi:hypothetical protein
MGFHVQREPVLVNPLDATWDSLVRWCNSTIRTCESVMAGLRRMESTGLHTGHLLHAVGFFKTRCTSYLSIGSSRERGYVKKRDPELVLLKLAVTSG